MGYRIDVWYPTSYSRQQGQSCRPARAPVAQRFFYLPKTPCYQHPLAPFVHERRIMLLIALKTHPGPLLGRKRQRRPPGPTAGP